MTSSVNIDVSRDCERARDTKQREQPRKATPMIKSLRSKPIRLIAIAVVPLALLGTACGSDDDSDNDSPANTEASSDAPADTAGGEESSSNPDVETFCDEVDDFVE